MPDPRRSAERPPVPKRRPSYSSSRSRIATATEFTAQSIALAIRSADPHEVIASGGGVHNRQIMGRLGELLPGIAVKTSADFGIDPDAKEAIAFAVLAREFVRGRPGNLPGATGARRAVPLGKNSPA